MDDLTELTLVELREQLMVGKKEYLTVESLDSQSVASLAFQKAVRRDHWRVKMLVEPKVERKVVHLVG